MAKRTMAAAVALLVAVSAGDLMAAGRGMGSAGSRGVARPATPPNPTTIRPADSQRRDGTFLSTGTTASGATTRPTKGSGNGLRDGSGMTATTSTAP